MDAITVEAFQRALAGRLAALGIETRIAEGGGAPQLGGTLRILLSVTERGDLCLTELVVSELGDGLDLLLFYTTVLPQIGPGYEALLSVLPDWNLLCTFGAFGVLREERQLYHKYAFPFPAGTETEALADIALTLTELIYETVSRRREEAAALSAGEGPTTGESIF